jgi:uncharacterized membrane protein YeaQ/YmgE (transglycosylase-associated protein family)
MLIDARGLLIVLIVGVVAGWIGVGSERGNAIGYLIAGMAGAYLAIYLSTLMNFRVPFDDPWVAQAAAAAVGAGFAIVLSRLFLSRSWRE